VTLFKKKEKHLFKTGADRFQRSILAVLELAEYTVVANEERSPRSS
jgi:hypothetical protein